MPPSVPRVRCGPTLPPVASPHLQCGPLKSPPAGGHHRAPKSVKRNSGPLRGAVMRRRAGQCWGLCSARCASHRPHLAGAAPLVGTPGPHPVKQCSTQGAASHPRRRFYQNGGRVAADAPRQHCGRASAATPAGSKSGHPAKRSAACGRDGHTGEHPSRVKYTACGGS